MGDTVEKIYCCDRDNNDNALAAAIMANGNNRRDDWGTPRSHRRPERVFGL